MQNSILLGRKQKHTYDKAIASVFFRFSHRNNKNKVLINQEQIAVVEQIINQIQKKMYQKQKSKERLVSGTFLQFFDLLEKNINTN